MRTDKLELHLEGDNIVTREGRVIRPLSDQERFDLAETARNPEILSQVLQNILRREGGGTAKPKLYVHTCLDNPRIICAACEQQRKE